MWELWNIKFLLLIVLPLLEEEIVEGLWFFELTVDKAQLLLGVGATGLTITSLILDMSYTLPDEQSWSYARCCVLDPLSVFKLWSLISTEASSNTAPLKGMTICLLYNLGVVLATIFCFWDLLFELTVCRSKFDWLNLDGSLMNTWWFEHWDETSSGVFWSLWWLVDLWFPSASWCYLTVGVRDRWLISSAILWCCPRRDYYLAMIVGWLDFFYSMTVWARACRFD